MIGKLRLLFWIGIVLLFVPFLGIPHTWKSVLTIVCAAAILAIVFRLRYAYKKMKFESRNMSAPSDEPITIHG